MDAALKIAFATTDQQHVDQHFGSCEALVVYLVTPCETHFHEVVAFQKAAQDGNEDKLQVRVEALQDCAAVYCRAIGASAIAQLKKVGVQPLKVPPDTPIKAQLMRLRKDLSDNPPFWAVRALDESKDTGRFDDMEQEGWSE